MTSPYLEKPTRSFAEYMIDQRGKRLNRDTYIPICSFSDGAWVMETRLGADRSEIIERMGEGQYEGRGFDCLGVWRVNPHEGSFEDVSEQIARDVLEILRATHDTVPDFLPSLVCEHFGPEIEEWAAGK